MSSSYMFFKGRIEEIIHNGGQGEKKMVILNVCMNFICNRQNNNGW